MQGVQVPIDLGRGIEARARTIEVGSGEWGLRSGEYPQGWVLVSKACSCEAVPSTQLDC